MSQHRGSIVARKLLLQETMTDAFARLRRLHGAPMNKSTLEQAASEQPMSLKPGYRAALVRPSMRQAFTSLKYRNYRLWYWGQMASLVGTWMQTTAQGFLVYELTGSPAYLGYVGFAAGVPMWLFALFGGVVTDRMARRHLLLITQSAMMLLGFVLAFLTFVGWVQPWHIILLAFCTGTANAFDAPARQAIVMDLVPREDWTNAIALNSTMFNLATAIGPAVAGLTYAALGAAWCFTINGVSFIAVIAALLLIRLGAGPSRVQTSALDDMREGVRYIGSAPIIQALIGTTALTTLFGLSFITLFPAWAVTVLGGDATTNGLLQSARGLGSLIGALGIASLGDIKGKTNVLVQASIALPVLLLVWAMMRSLSLSLLVLVGVGCAFMITRIMANTLVQTLVPDKLRGRVLSIYTLGFFGIMPLSALLAGAMAEAIGEPITIILGALVSLGVAVWLWRAMPRLRPAE
jgi:MFS family permease